MASAVPFVSLGCCLWITGAAALSVLLYQRWRPAATVVAAGGGARLGAATGVFAFVAFLLLHVFIALIFRTGGKFKQAMTEALQQSAARNPDPAAQKWVDWMSTPEGLAMLMTVVVAMFLAAFVVFGLLGGVIGASIWGRKQSS